MLYRIIVTIISIISFFGIFPSVYASTYNQISLKHGYQFYNFPIQENLIWGNFEKYYFNGNEVILSDEERKLLPNGILEVKIVRGVDRAYIANFLEVYVVPKLNREPKDATITLNDEKVNIEGEIHRGEKLNIPISVKLIEKALNEGIDEVKLAVDIIQPEMNIDPKLKMIGIKEIIAVGESDFTTSSDARIHNIRNAIKLFNGHIIKKDEEFSFVNVLGTVDASTGYEKELVIKGEETIKEYGGGICQVSSTMYRGAMLAGLPIIERGNHSYAVTYYAPWGSDATIYPGSHDLRFKNDTNGAILIYTHIEDKKLFFTFIGTINSNSVHIFGPFITNKIPAPPPKYIPSKTLPDGQKYLISQAHNGFTSTWYRNINDYNEQIVSRYQARPIVYKVGGLDEVKIGSLE